MNDGYRLLLGPDPSDLTGGGGGLGVSQPDPAATLPESGVTQAGDAAPVNGGPTRQDFSGALVDDPNGSSAGSGAGAPLTPADPNNAGWTGIRDAATARGFTFDGSVTDDHQALDHILRLAQQNRQADVHAQLGRQLAPHAPQLQQFFSGQAKAAPAIDPNGVPEFDPRWVSLVEPSGVPGVYVGKPGVPMEIVEKVNRYSDWKEKFDRNPSDFINRAAESRATEIAKTVYREQFAEMQRSQAINSITTQNSQWLFQVDATGQRATDFQGRPMLTPAGVRYTQHLRQAAQFGITDPTHQDTYAKNQVRAEYITAQQQQAAAASGQATNPQTQQQQFRQQVNPSAALPPSQRRSNPAANNEPNDEGLTLRERLMRDLAAEGVTDSDIAQSVGVQ